MDNQKYCPTMYMMIGLPASGKSYYAETLCKNMLSPCLIISSDSIREELFGDVNCQTENDKVFDVLHKRIINNLKRGYSVIYDATNLNKKRRIAFLQSLNKLNVCKVGILMATPYDICLYNNEKRERKVPEDVIKRMREHFQPPHKHEGFDYVDIVYNGDYNNYTPKLFGDDGILHNFNQMNEHHQLTLEEHCLKASEILQNIFFIDELSPLNIAARLHDIGKYYTQTRLNIHGEFDGNYHYYNHQCVGAYECLFYINNVILLNERKLYISNLIYYHMNPYMSWKQSEKAKERDRKLIGEKMYNDILMLHAADVYAH